MDNILTKEQAVKMLVKDGFGLPQACRIYNSLTSNGFYEITRKELRDWIKENGHG